MQGIYYYYYLVLLLLLLLLLLIIIIIILIADITTTNRTLRISKKAFLSYASSQAVKPLSLVELGSALAARSIAATSLWPL